ncbi:unnamed protein product [Staurois parvus]|uniref:Uncharacterized protein n=1 Tax=Staurois parvus TaxID=386267 RepID=A0ABN9EUX8_9NEOB|nr:unnamed protein product [Staurois parvus]
MARQEQCRSGLPFINGARHFGLCVLPLGHSEHRSLYGTSVPAIRCPLCPIVVRDLCVRSLSCDH